MVVCRCQKHQKQLQNYWQRLNITALQNWLTHVNEHYWKRLKQTHIQTQYTCTHTNAENDWVTHTPSERSFGVIKTKKNFKWLWFVFSSSRINTTGTRAHMSCAAHNITKGRANFDKCVDKGMLIGFNMPSLDCTFNFNFCFHIRCVCVQIARRQIAD